MDDKSQHTDNLSWILAEPSLRLELLMVASLHKVYLANPPKARIDLAKLCECQ